MRTGTYKEVFMPMPGIIPVPIIDAIQVAMLAMLMIVVMKKF